MNREQLVNSGLKIEQTTELSELCEKYEEWKTEVLQYAVGNGLNVERSKMLLHAVNTPYGSKEDMIDKYRSCIKKTIKFLQEETKCVEQNMDVVETIVKNFGLYLYNMFSIAPENRATLSKDTLEKIAINNEYDLQHIMYAVIKAVYPSARREVNQDVGYGTVRYDIVIEEIDTVIELKCTRKDHTEKKMFRELGEDAFFYKCARLIIYVYDKQNMIHDIDNFVRALERDKKTAGKTIKAYVEKEKELI